MIKVEEGNSEEIKKILSEKKISDVNAVNKNGYSALALAVKNGNFGITANLLISGADVNLKNNVYSFYIISFNFLISLDKVHFF